MVRGGLCSELGMIIDVGLICTGRGKIMLFLNIMKRYTNTTQRVVYFQDIMVEITLKNIVWIRAEFVPCNKVLMKFDISSKTGVSRADGFKLRNIK
eukprot:7520231-Ditylum_brightwellii.AAC.1